MLLNGSGQDTNAFSQSDLKDKHQNNVFQFETRRNTLYGHVLFETLLSVDKKSSFHQKNLLVNLLKT